MVLMQFRVGSGRHSVFDIVDKVSRLAFVKETANISKYPVITFEVYETDIGQSDMITSILSELPNGSEYLASA